VGLRLLLAEVLGLAALDLTFVAPALVLVALGLRFAPVDLGGAVLVAVAAAIGSVFTVLNGTPGGCDCTPHPFTINTSGNSTR
jgi:hypothetical protein